MIRFRVAAAIAALLLLSAAAPLTAADPAQGTEALDAAWAKAFQANDLEGVMACYAADAVAWLPDTAEAKGEKAIRDAYRAFFAENKVQDVRITETRSQTVRNRSVGWGRFELTLVPKSAAKPVTMTGRFTEVAEKRNGRWVYVVDHASADPPPPAAAKQ